MLRYACIVCGGYNDGNHKCPVELENRIEGGRRSHEDRDEYPKSYSRRLSDGFDLLNGSDENDY